MKTWLMSALVAMPSIQTQANREERRAEFAVALDRALPPDAAADELRDRVQAWAATLPGDPGVPAPHRPWWPWSRARATALIERAEDHADAIYAHVREALDLYLAKQNSARQTELVALIVREFAELHADLGAYPGRPASQLYHGAKQYLAMILLTMFITYGGVATGYHVFTPDEPALRAGHDLVSLYAALGVGAVGTVGLSIAPFTQSGRGLLFAAGDDEQEATAERAVEAFWERLTAWLHQDEHLRKLLPPGDESVGPEFLDHLNHYGEGVSAACELLLGDAEAVAARAAGSSSK